MSLLLFRLWPALLPLAIYWLWHLQAKRRARKEGKEIPRFRDGPLYWAIIASLATAILCFLFLGISHEKNDGIYIPPRVENGKIIPGHVEP